MHRRIRFWLATIGFLAPIALISARALATPLAFVNGGFDTGDLSGWTIRDNGGTYIASPFVSTFQTVAGTPSDAATLSLNPGFGNFGDTGFDLTQTITLAQPENILIRADVAASTADTNFFVDVAPISNEGTFDFDALLYFYPPATGVQRGTAEGTIYMPVGTYTVGFRFDISVSGPRGGLGGSAYLDNATMLVSDTPFPGENTCAGPAPNGGTFGCTVPEPVPEPSSLMFLAPGILISWFRLRMRRRIASESKVTG